MTATLKPAGRTLAEFQPLKPAEQKLLEACRQGTFAHISDTRPKAASEDNTVRAAFLRLLALRGDEQAPVHEHGVQLSGAWIAGELDMEAVRVPSNLTIGGCHFDITPVFRGAKIAGGLLLSGCQLPGLAGDGLTCERNVFLNKGFTATGAVRLLGAQIGGELSCEGAKFDGKAGIALSADRAVIKGDVFLDGSTATGAVLLMGVQIGGNLSCDGAKFDGKEGHALVADGMKVEGTFFFRDLANPVKGVSLASCHVSSLALFRQL